MKLYTNAIPGTHVTFVMVPIKAASWSWAARIPSQTANQMKAAAQGEGSPFWMGQFEITWNEYELFMYRTRKAHAGHHRDGCSGRQVGGRRHNILEALRRDELWMARTDTRRSA